MTDKFSNYLKHLILFIIGGFIYILIEILWRGHSHWSMFIAGGVCFLLIGCINEYFTWDMSLILQGIFGSIFVTLIEFVFGLIFNVLLGMNIWDYSNMPLNLLGQICIPFMLLWVPLSIIAVVADDYLRYWLFREERPRYRFI